MIMGTQTDMTREEKLDLRLGGKKGIKPVWKS